VTTVRVPLAWRGVTHEKKKFILSVAGITFATALMFMQLGFLNAVFDSQAILLRRLNADLILTNRSKHNMSAFEPIAGIRLVQAKAMDGVAAVYPLYIQTGDWRNPDTGELHGLRVLGVSPDDPVLTGILPDARLREANTVLFDRRSKDGYGPRREGLRTELAGHQVRIAGLVELGTDFDFSGTVIISEANFLRIFPAEQTAGPDIGRVELGLVWVSAGRDKKSVQGALQRALQVDVQVWTKEELIAHEIYFWRVFTPIGFIFETGLIIGFITGVMICTQILFTSVVDRMPLFGTLKAIGYTNGYLVRLVLREALLLAVIGFIPGVLIAVVLYSQLESIIGFDMVLNPQRILLVFAFTAGMSLMAAFLAIRKATTADPAEVFK
jgi:putative ABC transport system permease protein